MNPDQPITYSLINSHYYPGIYYSDIEVFGKSLLTQMDKNYEPLIDNFTAFLSKNKEEQIHSREVYLFEALMLGMFWNIYGGYAAGTCSTTVRLMNHTALLRRQHGIRRKIADAARAALAFRLLEKPALQMLFLSPDTRNLKKLIHWMEATGEFHREAKRLSVWLAFFESENETYTYDNISILKSFAAWFNTESLSVLGPYTVGVNPFLREIKQSMRFREDKISVYRQRSEYHLNMVGAWIYNRALRQEFSNCSEKIVLLPACMKAKTVSECKATAAGRGEICTGCTKTCQINQVRQLGLQHNFKVEIVTHSSDISVGKPLMRGGTGFVGVACAATVIAGGLELMDKCIPAQCVLLNQSGCRHWSNKPASTSLNLNELLYRIGLPSESSAKPDREKQKVRIVLPPENRQISKCYA